MIGPGKRKGSRRKRGGTVERLLEKEELKARITLGNNFREDRCPLEGGLGSSRQESKG